MTRNKLFYGDNLEILRQAEYFPDECVDLIYLDPPFNSARNYNVLFSDQSGKESEAQITAFEDTWEWGPIAQDTYEDLIANAPYGVDTAISAMMTLVGPSPMLAYLVMMAARLVELHRVLKPTGSLYLHCDPTASHYLKIILDAIFGATNFRNEIIWKRSSAHNDAKQGAKQMGRIHDVILFYTKSDDWTWNHVYTSYDEEYVNNNYRHIETGSDRRYRVDNLTAAKGGGNTSYLWRVKSLAGKNDWQADLDNEYKNPKSGWDYKGVPPYRGRFWAYSFENMIKFEEENRLYYSRSGMPNYKRYLDEMPGVPIQDLWDNIHPVSSRSSERLGYPTQKPISLLERIIAASSNPGDVVLDPFCGCGTTIAAAQKLGRSWLGIDITHLSTALLKYRLEDMFDIKAGTDYELVGEPVTTDAAQMLAEQDRYQFQFWALSLVRAKPLGGQVGGRKGKRGADKGIDGVINFFNGKDGKKTERVLIQVKSGKVKSGDIRDLVGTVGREKAALGVFITLADPSKDMVKEALTAGVYESETWGQSYRKIQILTISQLLDGAEIHMPPTGSHATFKQAERVRQSDAAQKKLL